jgi:hypothetical protein
MRDSAGNELGITALEINVSIVALICKPNSFQDFVSNSLVI